MYKKVLDLVTNIEKEDVVLRIADHAHIPFDPDNTDYQQYLKWLEEGNTPLPAEENN